MEWRKIKSIVILFLLCVSIFFIVMIDIQYKSNFLLDSESIDNLVSILNNDGISVERSVIPDNIYSLNVYEGAYTDKYYANTYEYLSGEKEYMPIATADGAVRFIRKENQGGEEGDSIYEFSGLFGFKYSNFASAEYSDIKQDYKEISLNNSRKKKLVRLINEFLFHSYGKSGEGFNADIDNVYYDSQSGIYYIEFIQKIGAVGLNGFDFIALTDGETVYRLEGNVLFSIPYNSYKVSSYDQVNILMKEKNYIDTEYISADSRVKAVITDMSIGYIISWNSKRNIYYLIPSWKISYADGTERIRNSVTGTLYGQ